MATTLVLVHGAWGRPDDWDPVIEHLGDRPAVCVDLPSAQRPATLADDVAATADVLAAIEGPVTLVGHSYGGWVITGAGDAPNVEHLVYVASAMPEEGQSLAQIVDVDLDGDRAPLSPPPGAAMTELAGWELDDGSYSPEAVARRRARPRRPFSTAARYGGPDVAAWRHRPSTFVVATRDDAISPDLQRRYAERADEVVELDTPHLPHLEAPEQLAEILRRLP